MYITIYVIYEEKMAKQMIIRIAPELKNKVDRLARAQGKTTSDVVRELLEEYTRNHDIRPYIDDLWNRIGLKLSSRGVTPDKVRDAIQAVRKSR